MSIHKSKGLKFHTVILLGLEDYRLLASIMERHLRETGLLLERLPGPPYCTADPDQRLMLRLFYKIEVIFLLQKELSVSARLQELFKVLRNEKLGLRSLRKKLCGEDSQSGWIIVGKIQHSPRPAFQPLAPHPIPTLEQERSTCRRSETISSS